MGGNCCCWSCCCCNFRSNSFKIVNISIYYVVRELTCCSANCLSSSFCFSKAGRYSACGRLGLTLAAGASKTRSNKLGASFYQSHQSPSKEQKRGMITYIASNLRVSNRCGISSIIGIIKVSIWSSLVHTWHILKTKASTNR